MFKASRPESYDNANLRVYRAMNSDKASKAYDTRGAHLADNYGGRVVGWERVGGGQESGRKSKCL